MTLKSAGPGVYFADDGAPRSERFGDIYYSLQDGLDEARTVFLRGCHLPEGWQNCQDFTVLELGFGTGLNIAALMQLWAKTRPPGGHLHVFSVEGFLMGRGDAEKALVHWPELGLFAQALLAQWPSVSQGRARHGFHCMDFPQWGVSLTLALMEVKAALAAWEGQADAIFLDGFSPACNPDMWSPQVFAAIAARAMPGTRLSTFTVAGIVRRSLTEVGFTVEKCPGFGRKRERLEAIFTPEAGRPTPVRRPERIAIIGAGIAGCALFHEARLLGLSPDIFDAEAVGSGASGNAAALVTPRLDAGDNAISALFADAFSYARDLYCRLCPEAILGKGVQQCEATPQDASRFARIQAQLVFAADDLSLFAPGEAEDIPGAAGITLASALWIDPKPLLQKLLHGQEPTVVRLSGFGRDQEGRHVLTDESGTPWGRYDAVILACGEGIFDLAGYRARYDLRPVRGQVEVVRSNVPLGSALSWGGYAIPLPGGFIFGATHEREDRGTDVRSADRARNLESLAKVMPERAAAALSGDVVSRASIRVMTRDYLPVAGEMSEGLYALTGMGARGFCLAPLLARATIADILGAPSPLPKVAKSLLRPDRLSTV